MTSFKSGAEYTGKPRGRPKGSKNRYSVGELRAAFEKTCKGRNGCSFIDWLAIKVMSCDLDDRLLLKFGAMVIDSRQTVIVKPGDSEWVEHTPSEAAEMMDQMTVGEKPKKRKKSKKKCKSSGHN